MICQPVGAKRCVSLAHDFGWGIVMYCKVVGSSGRESFPGGLLQVLPALSPGNERPE
jgi:hypothetical protein